MSEITEEIEKETEKKTVKDAKQEVKYSKEEILIGNAFIGTEKDKLQVLLENNKKYTIENCIEILRKENRRVIK